MEHRYQVAFDELKERHNYNSGATEIPYISNLELIFEGYFYNAKNIVRDMGIMMKIIYGKQFSDAGDWCAFDNKKCSRVYLYFQHLAQRYRGYETIQNMVENSRDAIELIVRIRNAIEHPGKKSGVLSITNCKISPDGIQGPEFGFEGESERYSVIESLKQFHTMLLDLAETIIVFGLMFKFQIPDLALQHIAKEGRSTDEPRAWRVITITSEMKRSSEPFDGKPKAKDRSPT